MRFLDVIRPPATMRCVYCGAEGAFAFRHAYEYETREFRLHACPDCGSLHYDPPETLLKVSFPYTPEYIENTRVGAKFFFEAGYYAEWTVICALAALAGVDRTQPDRVRFVDIGAGFGLSSYFVREVLGIEPVIVEPAYSGEIGARLLGLQIERAYFEDLPPEVMARMAGRACRLHLNSVVEHLADPAEPLRQAMRLVDVEAVAAIVPNGDFVDPKAPFLTMLPTLAPGDHLHLPTREGMVRFMRRLGFSHADVIVQTGLLIAVGARRPLLMPNQAEITSAADALLRRLSDHADPSISVPALARRLHMAVQDPLRAPGDALRQDLRERLVAAIDRDALLARLGSGESWPDIPFNIVVTAHALGRDALERNFIGDALAWFDVAEPAATEIAELHPLYSGLSIDYRWTTRLLRAQALLSGGRFSAAETVLDDIIHSTGPLAAGPGQVGEARTIKARLRGWQGWLTWLHFRVVLPALRSKSAVSYFLLYARFYLRWAGYWAEHAWRHVTFAASWLPYWGEIARQYVVHGGRHAVYWGWFAVGYVATTLRLLPGRALVVFRHAIARRRDGAVVRALATLSRKFVRAIDNVGNVDVRSNGDLFALRLVAGRGAVIDVGAHDGRFAHAAANLVTPAAVHAIEPDDTQRNLCAFRCRRQANVEVTATLPDATDGPIALLRIALPGAEAAVLDHLEPALAAGRIAAVRFIHGPAHAAQRIMLTDLVARFAGYGMTVHHLLPRSLAPVTPAMEDFGGRSFLALRGDVTLP